MLRDIIRLTAGAVVLALYMVSLGGAVLVIGIALGA